MWLCTATQMIYSSSMLKVKEARKKLGARGEKLTDKEIQTILNTLSYICDKIIEEIVTVKNF